MVVSLCLLTAPLNAAAQDERGHAHHLPPVESAQPGAEDEQMSDMHLEHSEHAMVGPLGLSHAREGSGTAWQPDSTPMYAIHSRLGSWSLMFHGSVFAGYDWQSGDRGGQKFISVNWFMAMARHQLAGGEFGARAMLSAEPFTVGDSGYPLLLQTGESFRGSPIHDRQHAHDLFMELAVTYSRPISDSVAVQIYAAPAGEPALGPVAFPHRLSASSDPLAPLSHHWADSTHITFGVVTAGVFTRYFKLEGSWFNGREPDENRYDFDFRPLDSYSGRIQVNPSDALSFQTSYGYLKSPEELEPDVSIHRITASATYNRPIGAAGNWASTAVWGRNIPSTGSATDALLLESNLDLDGSNTLFGRLELVRKSGHDLVVPPPQDEDVFNIGSLVLGYVHDFGPWASLSPGLGVRGSVNLIERGLSPFYGTRAPTGLMVFLRLRLARMQMHGSGKAHGW
jgi:hypothetical protein